MPKRYHELTQRERIEESDKVAVMELEKELRKKVRKPSIFEVVEDCLSNEPWKAIEYWLSRKLDVRKAIEEWLKKRR